MGKFGLSVATQLVCMAVFFGVGAVSAWALGEKATADIKTGDGREVGSIKMVETTAGVLLKVKFKGLTPGVHGFHIHEAGKCEGDFQSAGGIYNPLGARHGYLNDEGPMVGDLPNLFVGATGDLELEMVSPFVTLNKAAEESIFDSDGTAFVLFEKADDYVSEPDGNAGARIACGVILPAK
jgi:superoxide dismutase, Cu-Zn family